MSCVARASPAAQRWRHHGKDMVHGCSNGAFSPADRGTNRAKIEKEAVPEDPDVLEAFASEIPLRCPKSMIRTGVKRIAGLNCAEGLAALRDGIAFVSPATDLIGGADSPLLKWGPSYLRKHLPKEMKWPVLHRGTSKIIMTHTNRYMKDAELKELERGGGEHGAAATSGGADGGFDRVRRQNMSFDDFLEATREHERRLREGLPSEPPYFGSDVLWRNSMADNGNIQNIGERMKQDLLGGANFASLRTLMEAGHLPLMKQVHLFVGSARTLYHCHYDLQPNLHVQLVGRKRFIMFPPEEGSRLYAFPVHHDKDRRSQVDLDAPDEDAFPGCTGAHAQVVELRPGEMLYIPPGWWHHVQTCSSPCVSMAWWFYERRRSDARAEDGVAPVVAAAEDPHAHRAVDPRHFGVCGSAMEAFLSRWLEESLGKLLAPDAEVLAEQRRLGAEQAHKSGAVWGGPKKERAVARWMFAIGWAAARRLVRQQGARAAGSPAGWTVKEEEAGAHELLMTPGEMAAEGVDAMVDILTLPPMLEGIGFDLVEETIHAKIREELGAAKRRTMHASRRGGSVSADGEMGAPVSEEAADRWIVRVVRGRGFGRRGPAA